MLRTSTRGPAAAMIVNSDSAAENTIDGAGEQRLFAFKFRGFTPLFPFPGFLEKPHALKICSLLYVIPFFP